MASGTAVISREAFACRWFVKSAAVLEAAYEEVEAARLIDHPKQAALQKILTGVVTMHPVSIQNHSVFITEHPSPDSTSALTSMT